MSWSCTFFKYHISAVIQIPESLLQLLQCDIYLLRLDETQAN